MESIEKELDKFVQIWACKHKSYVSSSKAECGHHYIRKGNSRLLRWDEKNIIPLTFNEHTLHHAGQLDIQIKNPFREQYLINMRNIQLKDYLLQNNLTEEEWLKQKYQYWKNKCKNNDL
jgi:hypothetical protein